MKVASEAGGFIAILAGRLPYAKHLLAETDKVK